MFAVHIHQFVENLEILRGFVEAIVPIFAERDKHLATSRATDLAPILLLFRHIVDKENLPDAVFDPEIETAIRSKFEGDIVIEEREGGQGLTLRMSGPGQKRFQEALEKVTHNIQQL